MATSKKKAKPKKKTKTKPKTKRKPVTLATLATWTKVPSETASASWDLGDGTNDSVHLEDSFGDTPDHYMVHKGSVKVKGAAILSGWNCAKDSQQTVYVIDGDLTVDGPIVFDQADICTTLWVTGTLTAKRLLVASSALLIAGEALVVSDLLVTDLEDAGHLIVHGTTSSGAWLDLAQGRGCIELAKPYTSRYLSDHYADKPLQESEADAEQFRPNNFAAETATAAVTAAMLADGRPSHHTIMKALLGGTQIVR